ncbi:MAG: hypothetical protein JJT76_02465 [Clostridiaceae bacterium]|nr:hypothetical protein [Clostridiaceae bacterium]
MRLEKILEEQGEIACILAVYEKNLGNATQIVLKEGEDVLLPQSIDSTLRAIASYYALHLRLLRRKQQKLLNTKYYVPLPLHRNLLLFPVKTRVPKVKNDSSTSYINYLHVKKVDTSKDAIHLHNGRIIPSLNTSATLRKRYHQASLCSRLYEEDHHSGGYVKESTVDYGAPATKEDIDTLKRELLYLRGMLNGFLKTKE